MTDGRDSNDDDCYGGSGYSSHVIGDCEEIDGGTAAEVTVPKPAALVVMTTPALPSVLPLRPQCCRSDHDKRGQETSHCPA